MLTGSFSSFLASFLHSSHPSHEVTNNEYRFYFNLLIKTIGLHRYLVKYIYSTLLHVLAFHFLVLLFSRSPISYGPLTGEACAVVPILHLYKTGQNSSAQRHLVNSEPYSLFFFVIFFSLKKHVKSIREKCG